MDEIVREAFEDARELGQARQLNVTLETPEKPVSVIGDRHRLRQMLLILIDNAVKYNRDGGSIRIALAATADAAEFRIWNSGGAISAETQQTLFKRFSRGDNGAGQVEGCGLGLSIARSIVQAHGGEISVQPGSGDETVALVRIPTRTGF